MGEIRNVSFHSSFNSRLEAGFQDSPIPSSGGVVRREPCKRFGFFRPLLILAGQRVSWSPYLILVELWRLFTNIRTQREIFGLLKLRAFAEVAHDNPGLAFKYVIPNYLARSFTIAQRATCFLHHYRRIHAALSESLLLEILRGEVAVHEIAKGGHRFAVTIGLPKPPFDKEGELSFNLRINGKKVFELSFAIVPGWVVRSGAAEVLLVTRLQGSLECRPQLRLLRKHLHEYSPKKLLLCALHGFASAFGVDEFVAVCATNQKSYEKHLAAGLERCYDGFFANIGMTKTAAGFYHCSTLIEGKPLASLKGRNRSQARKRQAMRHLLQSDCAAFVLGAIDRASNAPSGAMNSAAVWRTAESRPRATSCPTRDNKLTL